MQIEQGKSQSPEGVALRQPANSSGKTQNGSWLQGTDPVKGVSGGGALTNRFSFDFYDHGKGQTFNASFTYQGTMGEAAEELGKAGYKFSALDQEFNFREMWAHPGAGNFRTSGDKGTGRNSGHALIDLNLNPFYQVPTTGSIHTGETNPLASFSAAWQHGTKEQ